MTIVAVVTARNMGRVLAGRGDAVVAAIACTPYLRVIDGHDRCPQVGRVAILADVRCPHVSRVLTGCVRAVVAAHTVSGNVHVIEICRQPGDSAVAIIAGIAARQVSRVLAGRGDAVVAGTAGSDDLGVIDGDNGRPRRRPMAILANVGRLNV